MHKECHVYRTFTIMYYSNSTFNKYSTTDQFCEYIHVMSQRALRLYCVECQSCSASPRLSTWNVALLMLGAQCFL